MMYKTILTSKGTTTIPAEIRKQLGIKPGMYISFEQNKQTGEYTIKKTLTIEEVRAMNKAALAKVPAAAKEYKSGDGFSTHVNEKYGK